MNGNRLLDAFSPECREFIRDRALIKPIVSGEVLLVEGSPLYNMIFPLDGLVSMQVPTRDSRTVEGLAVGREGVIAGDFVLGLRHYPLRAVAVVSGSAVWLPTGVCAEAMDRFPCMMPAVLGGMAAMLRRLSQSVLCASLHPATQRIASWLLHADDRTQGPSFDLTQRAISEILGLRQATVSEACNRLALASAISYSRGAITIRDRSRLEENACECYCNVRLDRIEDDMRAPLPQ